MWLLSFLAAVAGSCKDFSQAGLQPWERGRRGHAVGGTGRTLLGLSGLLIVTCTPKSQQSARVTGFFTACSVRLG